MEANNPEIKALSPPLKPEIKPRRPGILADSLSTDEKLGKPVVDDLIVFGQGPVIDVHTKAKPTEQTQKVEAISWMETIARAAGELKKAGVVKRIILTGGRTGGPTHKSEAELMKRILIDEYQIPEDQIVLEEEATNTLTNFAYTINLIYRDRVSKPDEHRSIGVLGADFHLPRIRLLADLFDLPIDNSFSAEQVFRLIAYKTNDQQLHQLLDQRLNPNEDLSIPGTRIDWKYFQGLSTELKKQQPSRSVRKAQTYFERFSSEEKRGIIVRLRGENRWTYGLLEIPAYWIGYLGYLENEEKIRSVLSNFNPNLLKQLDIDLQRPIDQIRKQLLDYTGPKRTGPEESWETDSFPLSTQSKLQQIVDNKK